MALISVIIPTYNRRHLLLEAIESVRGQDWPELEIIVVDDGSTDGTSAALETLDEPRMLVLRQSNSGRSAARNRGLAVARGELVSFLDDDDLYLPRKTAVQAQWLLDNAGIDIVGSGWRTVNTALETIDVSRPWEAVEEPTLLNLLQNGCPCTPSSLTVRSDALRRLGISFDTTLHYGEDTDFLLRLLAHGCRMAWAPEVLTVYRKHADRPLHVELAPALNLFKIVKRIFDTDGLPREVEAQKDLILGRARIVLGMTAAILGMDSIAARAFRSAEGLVDIDSEDLATMVGRNAAYMPEDQGVSYIDKVYDLVPEMWRGGRSRAVARMHELPRQGDSS